MGRRLGTSTSSRRRALDAFVCSTTTACSSSPSWYGGKTMPIDKLVIFGTGDIAQIAAYYFERDGLADVVAFTVDAAYRDADEYEGRPLVSFDEVAARYSPEDHKMFVALSYAQMNRLRARKVEEAK